MKRCIFSAFVGAIAMLVAIIVIAKFNVPSEQRGSEHEHIDYESTITKAECYICGDSIASAYWGEDNVALINLNNFDLLYLGINRYGEGRELIREPAGVLLSCGLTDQEVGTYAHAFIFPDNGYASLKITGARYAIDRTSVQTSLCQTCLDALNNLWLDDYPVAEYAIISFEERSIRPLVSSNPWFAAGNFGVNCEFNENGDIDLLIYHCPNRYE